ncbi:hypothetical protein D1872_257670 [compost metagenome]
MGRFPVHLNDPVPQVQVPAVHIDGHIFILHGGKGDTYRGLSQSVYGTHRRPLQTVRSQLFQKGVAQIGGNRLRPVINNANPG